MALTTNEMANFDELSVDKRVEGKYKLIVFSAKEMSVGKYSLHYKHVQTSAGRDTKFSRPSYKFGCKRIKDNINYA